MEGLIFFVELPSQAESNDVVMGYNCDTPVGLLVLPQKVLDSLGPPPQVGGCLVDKGLLHVLEYYLHHLHEPFLFVRIDDPPVDGLVLLALVRQHPVGAKPLHPRKVVAAELCFLELDLMAEIARASESFCEYRLDYDGTGVVLEYFSASHEGPFERRNQDEVGFVVPQVLSRLPALVSILSTCSKPWGVMGASSSLCEYLTVWMNSWLADRCCQS